MTIALAVWILYGHSGTPVIETLENTQKTDPYDTVREFVDDNCMGDVRAQLDAVCTSSNGFSMIWDQNDTNRVIPSEKYDADITFHTVGPSPGTLRSYSAQQAQLEAALNDTRLAYGTIALEDERCSFVKNNLPDAQKYIFLNNNKLLSHPQGPKEPNLCYIPPMVSNVLYSEHLCSSSNEMLYHPDFSNIIEIRGLDIHNVLDKDVGNPMCVIRFKEQIESGLSQKQYIEKLGDYIQYLYKMDPERQNWRDSTQWLFNKNMSDQTKIAQEMTKKTLGGENLDLLQKQLDEILRRIRGYMINPNLYINDYVSLDGDIDLQNQAPKPIDVVGREKDVAIHCANHGQTNDVRFGKTYAGTDGVGAHLAHLATYSVGDMVDRWKNYVPEEAVGETGRVRQALDYVTDRAIFKSVWERPLSPNAGDPLDRRAKERKCETLVYQNDEIDGFPWLGFEKLSYNPILGAKQEKHCTVRATDKESCETYHRESCTWDQLDALDRADKGARRKESCPWANARNVQDDYNCDQVDRLFRGDNAVPNYYNMLEDVDENPKSVDDSLTQFLVDKRNPYKFDDNIQCVHRDKVDVNGKPENGGCLTQFDDERLPLPPGAKTLVFGKGNFKDTDPPLTQYYSDDREEVENTNLVWGGDLVVTEQNGSVTIEGKPDKIIQEKLLNVLDNNEDMIKLQKVYDIFAKNDTGMKPAYITGLVEDTAETDFYMKVEGEPHDTDDCDSKETCNYALPRGVCSLVDGKMIVDNDSWLSLENAQVGDTFIRKRTTMDDKDPRNTSVDCELDPSKIEDGKTYTGVQQQDRVTLEKTDCQVIVPILGKTVVVKDEPSKTNTCAISGQFSKDSLYTFNRAGRNFNQLQKSGLLHTNANGMPSPIKSDGVQAEDLLTNNLYIYKNNGEFQKANFALGHEHLQWYDMDMNKQKNCAPVKGYAVLDKDFNAECASTNSQTRIDNNKVCQSAVQCTELGDTPGFYFYDGKELDNFQRTGLYNTILKEDASQPAMKCDIASGFHIFRPKLVTGEDISPNTPYFIQNVNNIVTAAKTTDSTYVHWKDGSVKIRDGYGAIAKSSVSNHASTCYNLNKNSESIVQAETCTGPDTGNCFKYSPYIELNGNKLKPFLVDAQGLKRGSPYDSLSVEYSVQRQGSAVDTTKYTGEHILNNAGKYIVKAQLKKDNEYVTDAVEFEFNVCSGCTSTVTNETTVVPSDNQIKISHMLFAWSPVKEVPNVVNEEACGTYLKGAGVHGAFRKTDNKCFVVEDGQAVNTLSTVADSNFVTFLHVPGSVAGAQPVGGVGAQPVGGAEAQPVGGAGTQPVGQGAGTQPVGQGAGTQPVGQGEHVITQSVHTCENYPRNVNPINNAFPYRSFVDNRYFSITANCSVRAFNPG